MLQTDRRPVSASALLSAALLLGLGCGGGSPNAPAGPKVGKPDFALTSKELAQEYLKDKQAAAAKYKDKVMEVTGRVRGFAPLTDGRVSITVEGDPNNHLFGFVSCFTADPKSWTKVTPGQTVKLKGKWHENFVAVILMDCAIEEVTGPPSPTLTADEFAKEFAKDGEGAQKKYAHKYLILTGELSKAEATKVTFKTGPGAPRVVCIFTPDDEASLKGLKSGQHVKILGLCGLADKQGVSVDTCLLMDRGK